MMMKVTLFLIFLSVSAVTANGQGKLDIDTLDIVFKAKLLTIANYGLLGKDEVIDTLQRQPHYLYKPNNDYMVLKILHRQSFEVRYKRGKLNNTCENHFGPHCEFILVFSYKSYSFFRIKGFDTNDFSALYKEVNPSKYTIYGLFTDEILKMGNLDLDYLIKKYVKKKRAIKDIYEQCNTCSGPAKIY